MSRSPDQSQPMESIKKYVDWWSRRLGFSGSKGRCVRPCQGVVPMELNAAFASLPQHTLKVCNGYIWIIVLANISGIGYLPLFCQTVFN